MSLPITDFLHQVQRYNRIGEILEERGIKYKWLAEQVNTAAPTVSRWCSNSIQPRVHMLFAIAKALDVDVRELLVSTKQDEENSKG